jgi:hypothetical protein
MVPSQSYLENLVLLKHLTRNVEGQVLAVDNTLHKVEVVRDQILTVVHDEHTAHIQLDVVELLLLVKEIKLQARARAKGFRISTQNTQGEHSNDDATQMSWMLLISKSYGLRFRKILECELACVFSVLTGARLGTNKIDLNSSCPSTLKCLTDKCSSQSLVIDL